MKGLEHERIRRASRRDHGGGGCKGSAYWDQHLLCGMSSWRSAQQADRWQDSDQQATPPGDAIRRFLGALPSSGDIVNDSSAGACDGSAMKAPKRVACEASDADVTKPEGRFFFLEAEVLEESCTWERDEFALYLLHCRGYNPVSAGSTYGEKGCRQLIGLSRMPWTLQTRWLAERGLIRTIEQGKHPVTLLASAKQPFVQSFAPTKADYRQHDGHVWSSLVDESAQLIKIPWRAMDIDRMNPDARIGALSRVQSLRLLAWAYGEAHEDGWVSSSLLWLDSEDGVIGRSALDVRARLDLSPDEVRDAVAELLDRGLLESRELDRKGRGMLFLAHPLKTPEESQEEIEGSQAA